MWHNRGLCRGRWKRVASSTWIKSQIPSIIILVSNVGFYSGNSTFSLAVPCSPIFKIYACSINVFVNKPIWHFCFKLAHACMCQGKMCCPKIYVKPIAVEPYGKWTDLDQHHPQICVGVTSTVYFIHANDRLP